MTSSVHTHRLPSGITLLAEEMPTVSSGAISILIPTGAVTDPKGQEGAAVVLTELMTKGAGPWDSRQLSEQFEAIGAHHSHTAGIEATVFSGALLGENLPQIIRLLGTVTRLPRLPAGEDLENVRELALQELRSLEDDLAGKVMVELAKDLYPFPYGRSQLGTEEGLRALTIDSLREYYRAQFVPDRVVIGVAGKFSWPELKQEIEAAFGDWTGTKAPPPAPTRSRKESVRHIAKDTNQSQIALAYPSVSYDSPDYYIAKVAVGVLSGGMSGRLFVEVREKRGLVYRVSASHSAAKGRAAVFGFAGTTPDRAEETLSVMMTELRSLQNGVTEEELKRSKADLKARVIMQGEISSARASALVNDWWNLGRVRTLGEIKDAIDAVRAEEIVRHLREHPVSPVTLVTLGPNPLSLPPA